MKLWGGRFSEATDKIVDDFNSSIRFDQRLYYYDIKGSIAHARMLGNCSIIPEEEAEMIITELNAILKDIEEGKIEFEVDAEDIHMNIEKILIDRIGDVGKKLHTGRSRNDQVALDIRMFLKEETTDIINMVKELMTVLVNIADKQKRTIIPLGYVPININGFLILRLFYLVQSLELPYIPCPLFQDQDRFHIEVFQLQVHYRPTLDGPVLALAPSIYQQLCHSWKRTCVLPDPSCFLCTLRFLKFHQLRLFLQECRGEYQSS
jgi:hypothetical protein